MIRGIFTPNVAPDSLTASRDVAADKAWRASLQGLHHPFRLRRSDFRFDQSRGERLEVKAPLRGGWVHSVCSLKKIAVIFTVWFPLSHSDMALNRRVEPLRAAQCSRGGIFPDRPAVDSRAEDTPHHRGVAGVAPGVEGRHLANDAPSLDFLHPTNRSSHLPPVFEKVVTGIPGIEGPLVTKDGRLFVVQPSGGLILEIGAGGEKTVLANTGGIPAGLQLHIDGSIWVADMKLGILRVTLDGKVTREVATFEGRPIRGCNDCSFDSRGNLYFTAPAGSSGDNPVGELFCRLTTGEVLRLDQGFAFCNGLAVSGDDTLLVVAETFTKLLHGYRLGAPGAVIEKFLFGTLPGDHRGGPDGIDFDAEGRLIATNLGAGHLEVFAPDGTLERRVLLPFEHPSNVHFEGPGSRTLLITEHTNHALWKTEWPCAGQLQFGWRREPEIPYEKTHQ